MIILGVILGFGDNRKIVVFSDYDDLGLTFLIQVSYFLIIYLGLNLNHSFVIIICHHKPPFWRFNLFLISSKFLNCVYDLHLILLLLFN